MVTMKQIAKKANVSITTVSLVLNNRDSGRVSPDVANNIRTIAMDMGYLTNRFAHGSKSDDTHIIAFLSDDVTSGPSTGHMLRGVQDAAHALGYMPIAVNLEGGRATSDREILTLRQFGVDGFVYASMSDRKATLPESLKGSRVVLANATDEDGTTPGITIDEHGVGHDATAHLAEDGCHRIAYVGLTGNVTAQPRRVSGYVDALAEHGIPFDPELMINVGDEDAAARIRRFLDAHPDVDGIFCFDDARTGAVQMEAKRRGLVVGRDIEVIGVGCRSGMSKCLAPATATVELPHYEMGYWAVGKLVSMITDAPVNRFPRNGYPLGKIQKLPPLTEHEPHITCHLRAAWA